MTPFLSVFSVLLSPLLYSHPLLQPYWAICSSQLFPREPDNFPGQLLPGRLTCTVPVPLTLSISTLHLSIACAVPPSWIYNIPRQTPCLSQIWIPSTGRCLLSKSIKAGIPKLLYQYWCGIILSFSFHQKWNWLMLTSSFSLYWFPWR